MAGVRDLHARWWDDADDRAAYDALGSTCVLAQRRATSRSVIARLERARPQPFTRALARLAEAAGTRLKIPFEQVDHSAA